MSLYARIESLATKMELRPGAVRAECAKELRALVRGTPVDWEARDNRLREELSDALGLPRDAKWPKLIQRAREWREDHQRFLTEVAGYAGMQCPESVGRSEVVQRVRHLANREFERRRPKELVLRVLLEEDEA